VVLHPPPDATRAELIYENGVWMVWYLGDRGSQPELPIDNMLRAEHPGGNAATEVVVDYIEGRLPDGRNPERVAVPSAVVAAWTLTPAEQHPTSSPL